MTLKEIAEKHECLTDWCILSMYRGSIAHGMYLPNSDPNSIDDKDIMAICVPPLEYYFGLKEFGSRSTKEIFQDEWDIVVYEVRKFISLLAKGNPNVLSMLWLDEEHYLHQDPPGQMIICNRELFVGKHVFYPFIGYAKDQLKRMTHQSYQGYMGEKRKRLVDQFGYDTKNAAHLIRLLRMAIEFLTNGQMKVNRQKAGDAQELLNIKTGQWSLEAVEREANKLFQDAEDAHEQSLLPEKLDWEKINELAVIVVDFTRGKYA